MKNVRYRPLQNDISDAVYVHAIGTYTYVIGQHEAAQKHATAIHALGGVANIQVDKTHFCMRLTPDFEKRSGWYDIYEIMDVQRTQEKEIKNSFKRPVSALGRAVSLLIIGGIGSCSYDIAPKSESEIVGWGTLFAAWGAATVVQSLHRQTIGTPNEQKMLETAVHIIKTNQRIIEDWNGPL